MSVKYDVVLMSKKIHWKFNSYISHNKQGICYNSLLMRLVSEFLSGHMKMTDLTFTTQVPAGDHNVYFILFQTAKAIALGKKQEFNQYFDSEFFTEWASLSLTLEEFYFFFLVDSNVGWLVQQNNASFSPGLIIHIYIVNT